MQLIGKQLMDFVARDTKQTVKGVKLFFLYLDAKVKGICPEDKFFPDTSPFYDIALSLPLNCTFKFEYTPKGAVCDIIFESESPQYYVLKQEVDDMLQGVKYAAESSVDKVEKK